jgi:DNA-binding protein HU-beta
MPKASAPALKTKADIIAALADKAGITKVQAKAALEALPGFILAGAKDGFTFPGLGKFAIGKRAARTARNPRTNEVIKVKASKVLKFKPAKVAKDAIQK